MRKVSYQTLPFTATEYEQLKKELAPQASVWNWMLSCLDSFECLGYLTYPAFFLASFFITTPAQAIANKLKFDFKSLITALNTYVTNYDSWGYHQQLAAWLEVGKAQRDVPVHIANEYCRPDRSFDPCPEFNEPALPRTRSFYNYVSNSLDSWFPLTSSSSGVGFDFGLLRGPVPRVGWGIRGAYDMPLSPAADARRSARMDLTAVSQLDEVRTADLTQSREILNVEAPRLGLGL